MKLGYKVWLDQEGKVFGRGPHELLSRVREVGSLAEAAKSMGMSYNKAFTMIRDIEQRLGYKLLDSKRGGNEKGGSTLTKEAERLIYTYETFVSECDQMLEELFRKHFPEE